jgi:phospholipid/cholesterol/gamma-HCH transport system permease protein
MELSFLSTNPRVWLRRMGELAWSWWFMVYVGALALVMAGSPNTYTRESRMATARFLHDSTWVVLPWFTALVGLVSLVLIRIVIVTASSYGLSQYAVEMVVRVLVLELIPLTAALFVSLRAGMAFDITDAWAAGRADQSEKAQEKLRNNLAPQVMANAFAVLTLAMVSSVIVLVLAYVNVYGFALGGLEAFTRTVGRVFNVPLTLGLMLKTGAFGLAVAVIPTAALLEIYRRGRRPQSTVQPGAVRLLFVLMLVEAASLAVKYI